MEQNYHKELIDELREIVGDKNLIEIEFEPHMKVIHIRTQIKDMSYGKDCMWLYKIKDGQNKDFYIMNFIKEHFKPIGNVLCCFDSFGVKTSEYDDVLYTREHGNNTINIISGMGVYYMTVTNKTLEWIKQMDEQEVDGWTIWHEVFEY